MSEGDERGNLRLPTAPPAIDISRWSEGGIYRTADNIREEIVTTSTKTEHREEMLSRLRLGEADARHRRLTFWAIFGVLVAAAIGSVLLFTLSSNPSDQAFGRTTATAVVGALVGYLGGSIASPARVP